MKTNRGYLSDIALISMFSTIPNWILAAIGRFISRINDKIVFTKSDIDDALTSVVDLGEEFHVTLCSDSFAILPVGEENRAGTLSRIDLDQLRHVSALHQDVTACLKQGKIKTSSIRVADENIMDISDFMDSDGNLRLDVSVIRNSIDDMIEPNAKFVADISTSKEILSKQSQFTRRGLQRRDDWLEWNYV